MSSFIGIVNGGKELTSKVGSVGKHLLPITDSTFCTIFAEPKSDRLNYSEHPSKGWITSGIGIHPYPNTALVSSSDWENLFTNDSNDLEHLNGHFAGVRFNEHCVELITDQIGIRSLFLIEAGNSFIFSTRIDWLLPFSNRTIDWKLLGENWLSVNAFSGNSLIEGIHRIHSSAKCSIDKNGLSYIPTSWSPSPSEIDIEEYLFKVTSAVFDETNSVSLGLSGGLDSRLLLAILAGNSDLDYDLYTFSGLGHPDERIASKLNVNLNKAHLFLDHSVTEFSLEALGNVAVRSMLNASISEFQALTLYNEIGRLGKKTIDGAIGEIGRRRFYRNIELRGKSALTFKNSESLSTFFFAPKADIFSDDIKPIMHQGFQENMEAVLSKMPDAKNFGIGNWLDLFTIRTRMINIAGMNQELSDESLFHLMPFVQPDFLNGVFSLPITERSNAKLFRNIIKKHLPSATTIPLVKGDQQYPFWMNDVTSLVWMRFQQKLGRSYKNYFLANLLQANESQIRDLFSSDTFKHSGFYNYKKANHLVSSFYDDNNYHHASSLNWLLTFELFRKTLGNESI